MVPPIQQFLNDINSSYKENDELSFSENLMSAYSPFHIKIDDQRKNVQIDTFLNALNTQPKLKYLKEECGICFEPFLSKDRIMILSCTHGFHENCFQPLMKQECPYDQTPRENLKVSFIGFTFLLRDKSEGLERLLNRYRATIDSKLEKMATELASDFRLGNNKYRYLFEKNIINNVMILMKNIIIGCLKSYCSLPTNYNRANIQNLVNSMLAATKALPGQENPDIDFLIDIDLRTVLDSYNFGCCSLKRHAGEWFQFTPLEDFMGALEAQSNPCYRFFDMVCRDILTLPSVEEFAERLDERFLARRYKEILTLPSENEKIKYLSKINLHSVGRLHRLTRGGRAPTAKLIATQSNRRYCRRSLRKCGDFLITLLGACFIGLGILYLFYIFRNTNSTSLTHKYYPYPNSSISLSPEDSKEVFMFRFCYPEEDYRQCESRNLDFLNNKCLPERSIQKCILSIVKTILPNTCAQYF